MPIAQPTLWDKLFDQMYTESIDKIKANSPGYTALLPSDPGIAVLDAFLFQAALLGEKLNILPHASLISWVNYLGVEKKGPSAARGSVRVVLAEPLDSIYIIPLGSRFLDTQGNTYLALEEGIIPVGETEIDIPIEAETRGAIGNVEANQIIFSYQTLPFVREIYNPEPLTGGFDSELDDEALDRGRNIIKHLWRAVTREDYEQLAVSVSGIKRAKAIDTPGNIILYLLAENGDPANQELRSDVLEFLDPRRLQAVGLQVLPAVIKEVNISANVRLMPGFSILAVTSVARANLSKVLNPLSWTWGRKVSISELFAALEETQGIDFVDEMNLPVENILLHTYELAKLGDLTLNAI